MQNSERQKGIFCILGAAFCFSLMTLFVRLAGDLPTFEKAFFRNAVAAVAALVVLKKREISVYAPKTGRSDVVLRALFGTIGLICNFYAIGALNLADANMLNKLSPFWATLCSVFLLKENVRPKQALILITAFLGAMLIVRPSGNNLQLIPGLIGLIGGIGAGIAYTFVRRASSKGVKGPVIVFYFSAFSSIVTAVLTLLTGFRTPSLRQLLCLLVCGAAATGGQFFITAAYSHAPAREISVYDYTQVIFSAILGFVFLRQVPDLLSFVGDAVILTMAVLNYRLNKKSAAG